MKFLQSNRRWHNTLISRVSDFLLTTTRSYNNTVRTSSSSSSSNPSNSNSLYQRISPFGDPKISIVPILNKWIGEGKDVKQTELVRMIKQLRSRNRFKQALQISEWMTDTMLLYFSPGDIAIRLDLISKVHGIKEAEKYFDSIPDSNKAKHVYGSLLNCYCYGKFVDKAESLMKKMKELGFVNTLTYNIMIKMYSQMEQYDKLDMLLQDMEDNGIAWDKFTYATRLCAYGATPDIDKMEKLLAKMADDPVVSIDWHSHVTMASGYLKVGLIEKVVSSLKNAEQLLPNCESRRYAYEIILTLYGSIGYKDDVHRMWKLYTLNRKNNSGYRSMISSLLKFNDIDGAEKIFKEWESGNTFYDVRVPNTMITGYCNKGLIDKAEALVNKLVMSGKELNASSWDRLASGYSIHDKMDKALETLEKAIVAMQPFARWKPDRSTVAACVKFLKNRGDIKVAEELIQSLKEQNLISRYTFDEYTRFINDVDPDSLPFDEIRRADKNQSYVDISEILEIR